MHYKRLPAKGPPPAHLQAVGLPLSIRSRRKPARFLVRLHRVPADHRGVGPVRAGLVVDLANDLELAEQQAAADLAAGKDALGLHHRPGRVDARHVGAAARGAARRVP